MNFSDSLSFAFKGQNLPKILTIVIIAVLSGISIFVAAMALENLWLLGLLIPVLIGYTFFISGYSISIIKTVMESDDERLPRIEPGRDLWRGFMVFLAGIVYMIPVIILTGIFAALIIGFSSTASADEPSVAGIAMICGGGLVWMLMLFTLSYSLIVGQIRYAAEERAGALFNIPKNFGIVMSHFGTTLAFLIRWIGIGLVFSIFSSIILNVINAFFTGVQLEAIEYITYDNYEGLASLGMPLAIFGSFYYLIALTISVMQSVSLAHLMAGFGAELGYAPEKLKNGEKSSGLSAVLIILGVVFLFGLMACAMITALAIFGPQVGETFSQMATEAATGY